MIRSTARVITFLKRSTSSLWLSKSLLPVASYKPSSHKSLSSQCMASLRAGLRESDLSCRMPSRWDGKLFTWCMPWPRSSLIGPSKWPLGATSIERLKNAAAFCTEMQHGLIQNVRQACKALIIIISDPQCSFQVKLVCASANHALCEMKTQATTLVFLVFSAKILVYIHVE